VKGGGGTSDITEHKHSRHQYRHTTREKTGLTKPTYLSIDNKIIMRLREIVVTQSAERERHDLVANRTNSADR
jgi:hypothetical protein